MSNETCGCCKETGHNAENCVYHICTGDNCYCIGGDENLDITMHLQDDYEAYCLNRVAPLGGD